MESAFRRRLDKDVVEGRVQYAVLTASIAPDAVALGRAQAPEEGSEGGSRGMGERSVPLKQSANEG
jgi:hypothetical protein